MRPEPAPTTWMIEAHSAFLSMSPTEAFWTLRILPRIGSSAWNSELRASLAVPSAESPSTMNSSVRSLSVARQSASLAGSARGLQGVLAALGLLVLAGRDAGSWRRRRPSPSPAWPGPSRPAWWRSGTSSAPPATTLRTTLRAAGVPRISLVWPSNCGSASRTVTTAVSPSRTSSLITSSSLTLSALVARITSLKVLVRACSKPLTWVPPLGVAITLTNDRSSVS